MHTHDTSCLELCLFFSWCAPNQQVLNVILEHDNDEETTQDKNMPMKMLAIPKATADLPSVQ